MVKRIVVYSLPEDTDPEEFWKYHTKEHGPEYVKLVGSRLKKYVINRVKEVKKGEQKFFALIEFWYENEEAMEEALRISENVKTRGGKTIRDDFWSRVTDGFAAMVEETQIVP